MRFAFVLALDLLIVAAIVACSEKRDDAVKQAYELQVQCGKQAEAEVDRMKKEFADAVWDETNHYNRKLKKCFLILGTTAGAYNYKSLYDVNENKGYASLALSYENFTRSVDYCEVQEKKCQSEEEWNSLVKDFMED